MNHRIPDPQCGWSCGSSGVLIDQMTYHILSKCGSSLHYGLACAFSESQPHQMTCCIGHNCMLFLCCEWLCAYSDLLLDWMIEHLCILPPLLAAYVSQFWFCFAQIRNIKHRGVWQTGSSILFNFLIFWKTFYSKTFQIFTCLVFLLNLLQLFWTPKFMAA